MTAHSQPSSLSSAQDVTALADAYIVSTFYQFFPFADYVSYKRSLIQLMEQHGLKGTVLLAPEGINGTLTGSRSGVDAFYGWMAEQLNIDALDAQEHPVDAMPFDRAKVKLKKELISMGVPAHPMQGVGEYLEPEAFHELIGDEEVLLLDARNGYEVELGTFDGAINPHTQHFKQLAHYVEVALADKKETPIATFCTGGIRCEKLTAYLKSEGFETVYHLKGGIINYMNTIPEAQSKWQGECFVFDEREAI